MIVQLDTNILTRIAQPSHPFHATALSAVRGLELAGHTLCIVPQNLFEFWVVATRPMANQGLGLAAVEAKAEFDKLRSAFALHLDPPSLLDEWEKLIVQYDCKGKVAHDIRIVASMNLHGVKHLLTFNGRDFVRYSSITLLEPAATATGARIP
jgi:predicted nucleic acid-binding protein